MRKDEIIRKLNKAYFSERPDEFRVLSKLHNIISDGEIFIDIGASLGQYKVH